MKKFFTKEYWTQEELQPRWLRWLNELTWVIIILQLFEED